MICNNFYFYNIERYEESTSKETEIMFYECVFKETKAILVLN
jgi:hypothetical protein